MRSIYLLILFLGFAGWLEGQTGPYMLDADTGNEMDDLYAIARAVAPDGLPIEVLSSAHFNNLQLITDETWNSYEVEGLNTLEESQRLNELILRETKRTDIPAIRGANRMLGFAWGYYAGAPVPESPATEWIIAEARKASPEEKLNIICLGAVTNAAAAVANAPEIVPNIRVYMLGAQYDPQKRVWNKSEFNIRNDLNAFDLLLSTEGLEMWVMPASTARALQFQKDDTLDKLASKSTPLRQRLADRWAQVNGGASWTMWDLALIEAILHPEMATVKKRRVPPENGRRKIWVYTAIEDDAMRSDFWKGLEGLDGR
ncbi:MAG TPA: nucleoside hydrolase [Saprospiraceae bacterium]|nr:nucleoside hydrolase [Saprospiraceae bacterium]